MLNILLKVVSFFVVSLMWLLASAYMNVWAALLLLNTCLTISFFTLKFARRDGLLANTVKENKKLVEYIMDNKDSMSKGREFLNQQPLIFALDLEDEFQAIGDTLEHNKTTAMKQILKLFR